MVLASRDDVKHPAMHRITPDPALPTRNLLAPTVNIAQIEKP